MMNNALHPPKVRQKITSAFLAMYDYFAQDRDEVSFKEGDLIINCSLITDGWMTGTVKRTGETGMIPANYVHPHYE
jgi:LIM and SH3 domain protein F42H10.3